MIVNMDSVTQEVLDARLETIETRMDGRVATLEVKIDGKFAGVDAKFAELRTDMHKGFADMTKWIVGTVIGVAAVTITIMTFVLNNAAPKSAATPATQPAPIACRWPDRHGSSSRSSCRCWWCTTPATPARCASRTRWWIMKWLKSAPVKKLVIVIGGVNPSGDVCEAMHYHGFIGQEKEVVDLMTE